jgi:DHA1 family bicyclomycin/chloramphenicol resistance-like MFS transporter
MCHPPLAATARVIALLTAVSALGALATSIYLPSMPAIGAALLASPAAVQHTLTAYLAAFAAGQLLWGPLSDRFGRRRVMVAGFVAYVGGSLACALATSLELLIAARIMQAVGASAGIVVGRAMVRDAFDGAQITKVLSAITVASAAVPAAAPLIGGVLEEMFGWRATFLAAAAIGLLVAVLALRNLPETNRRPRPRLNAMDVLQGYLSVARLPHFLGCAAVSASAFGALYAFFSGSPYVVINILGIAPAAYGLYPPVAVIGLVLGGVLTSRLAGHMRERQLLAMGLALMLSGAATMPFSVTRPIGIALSMFVFAAGMSVLGPVCTAAALRPFADRAGTAAALIGFLQMVAGALGSAIVAMPQPFGVQAFPLTMLGMTGIGALVFLGFKRRMDLR